MGVVGSSGSVGVVGSSGSVCVCGGLLGGVGAGLGFPHHLLVYSTSLCVWYLVLCAMEEEEDTVNAVAAVLLAVTLCRISG